jgi:hypothetical protein
MRFVRGECRGLGMKQISSFAKNFLTVHIVSDMMPPYKTGSKPFEQDLGAFRDC